ncbi:MAG: response regulator [Acidobacteria bacterium]|nr:response regulator [Acidobacteriota bacterium]
MATILVVEDEFGITEVLQSALADAGHNVLTAINGKQGLELLKDRRPELVLLDFMMPVLDGLGMLRAMTENPEYRGIPAILMSSLPESAVAEAADGTYAGFLRKPFQLRDAIAMVNRILNAGGPPTGEPMRSPG